MIVIIGAINNKNKDKISIALLILSAVIPVTMINDKVKIIRDDKKSKNSLRI